MAKDNIGRLLGDVMMSKSVACDTCDTLSLQCSDAVVWAMGRATRMLKAGCWFVDGDDLTRSLQVLYA